MRADRDIGAPSSAEYSPGALWLRADTALRALVAQVLAGAAAWYAFPALAAWAGYAPPVHASLALHAVLAAGLGNVLGLPAWWVPLNAGLPLAVWGATALALPPTWYLVAFLLAFLLFGASTLRSGVPLYLSGQDALAALSRLVPDTPVRVLDAGCGTGTALAALARRHPQALLAGVETALLPWLVARARLRGEARRCRVVLGDLWREDFARYDVVYAFLSPAAMPALLEKARCEMRPGSLLVSNAFDAQGHAADETVRAGADTLYLWRFT